jgi:hypothetical protein
MEEQMRRLMLGLISLGGIAAVAPVFLGCTMGYAEMVRRDTTGGVLALEGHRGAAMEDAQQQMAGHCQGPYQIVREEQVAVGEQTDTNYGSNYGSGYSSGGATTTTQQITQYQITYVCGGAAAPAPQQAMTPQTVQVQ